MLTIEFTNIKNKGFHFKPLMNIYEAAYSHILTNTMLYSIICTGSSNFMFHLVSDYSMA